MQAVCQARGKNNLFLIKDGALSTASCAEHTFSLLPWKFHAGRTQQDLTANCDDSASVQLSMLWRNWQKKSELRSNKKTLFLSSPTWLSFSSVWSFMFGISDRYLICSSCWKTELSQSCLLWDERTYPGRFCLLTRLDNPSSHKVSIQADSR